MNQILNEEYVQAKTRLATLQADKIAFALAVKRKEYVSVEEVAARSADEITRVKTKLLALPSRLAPQLVHQEAGEIFAALTAGIKEALSELAGYREGGNEE